MSASFLVFAMSNAAAQRDTLSTTSRDRVSIVAGFAGSQRRDLAVSPVTFAGFGYSTTATYDHSGARAALSASATWDAQQFRPQDRLISASERVSQGGVRLDVLRRVTGAGGVDILVGAAAAANGIGTEHRYADPNGTRATFFAAFATLGPAASLERHIAGGWMRLGAAAPIAGVVDRDYSAIRGGYSTVAIRRVGPNELRGLDAAASYSTSTSRPVGIDCAYRLSLTSYRDAQPLRAAVQSFSIGLSRRLGGAGR